MSIFKAFPPADQYWDRDGEWHDDEPGAPVTPSAPGYPQAPDWFDTNSPAPSNNNFNPQAELDKIFTDGFKPGETDLANLAAKNPEDRAQFLKDLQAQEDLRARPTASAGGMGGDAGYGDKPGIKPGWVQGPGGQYTFVGTGGGSGAPGTGGGGGGNPNLLSAAGGVYYPPTYTSNPNAPAPPALLAPYVAPTWTGGDFVEPTMAQVEASPGYETRRAAGQRTRERSAAAMGTVLNGGTQQALERYGQEYGTGEYQTFRTNAFQDYLTKYGQFVDKGNAEFGARQQNLAEGQTDYQNRYGAYNNENLRTLTDFTTNTAAQRGASNDYWDRLIAIYNGGRTTAGDSYQAPAG